MSLAASAAALFRSGGSTFIERVGATRGVKLVGALHLRCRFCKIVPRGRKVYVICSENPSHKQRSGRGGQTRLPHRNARSKDRVMPRYEDESSRKSTRKN